jgi:hypothetical protein
VDPDPWRRIGRRRCPKAAVRPAPAATSTRNLALSIPTASSPLTGDWHAGRSGSEHSSTKAKTHRTAFTNPQISFGRQSHGKHSITSPSFRQHSPNARDLSPKFPPVKSKVQGCLTWPHKNWTVLNEQNPVGLTVRQPRGFADEAIAAQFSGRSSCHTYQLLVILRANRRQSSLVHIRSLVGTFADARCRVW